MVYSQTLAEVCLPVPCLPNSPLHLLVFYNWTKLSCFVTVLLFFLLWFIGLIRSSFRRHCTNYSMRNRSNTKFLVRCDNIEIKITCLCEMVRASPGNDVSIASVVPELRLSGSVVLLISIQLSHVLSASMFSLIFQLLVSHYNSKFSTVRTWSAIGNIAE